MGKLVFIAWDHLSQMNLSTAFMNALRGTTTNLIVTVEINDIINTKIQEKNKIFNEILHTENMFKVPLSNQIQFYKQLKNLNAEPIDIGDICTPDSYRELHMANQIADRLKQNKDVICVIGIMHIQSILEKLDSKGIDIQNAKTIAFPQDHIDKNSLEEQLNSITSGSVDLYQDAKKAEKKFFGYKNVEINNKPNTFVDDCCRVFLSCFGYIQHESTDTNNSNSSKPHSLKMELKKNY